MVEIWSKKGPKFTISVQFKTILLSILVLFQSHFCSISNFCFDFNITRSGFFKRFFFLSKKCSNYLLCCLVIRSGTGGILMICNQSFFGFVESITEFLSDITLFIHFLTFPTFNVNYFLESIAIYLISF